MTFVGRLLLLKAGKRSNVRFISRDEGSCFANAMSRPHSRRSPPDRDPNWVPNAPSIPNTTPDSRTAYSVQVEKRAKTRVLSVDPHGGRCLIENCAATRSVDFCHCFPRYLAQENDLVRVNL